MDNTLLALAILHQAGFSQKDLEKIYPKLQDTWEDMDALKSGRIEFDWINPERKGKILEEIQKINENELIAKIKEFNIDIIIRENPRYPLRLKNIDRSPFLIYVRGELRESDICLWIVWSRKSTQYGKRILEKIIPELVSRNISIISGWAYGIDILAHTITLDHDWYTVSVFWCGVDQIYPTYNWRTFERILSSWWALLSIFPIWKEAEPYMFPVRNEIVAALSDGIVIPEAWIKSGTLITAHLALEQGKDVFAIPWDIFHETSKGTNMLIATGQAKCTTKYEDILEEYFPALPDKQVPLFREKEFDTQTEKNIYTLITSGHNTPDLIDNQSEYSIESIISTLTLLEIWGHIILWKSGKYEIL